MTEPQPDEPAPQRPEKPEKPAARLPVSEVAFDRPGGPSPFGEDTTFPLPVEQLRYLHS